MQPFPKILVTGAGGFLGNRIIHRLSDEGNVHIRCLVRSKTDFEKIKQLENALPEIELEAMKGNLCDPEDAGDAVKGVDTIIHCAAGKMGPLASMYSDTVVATKNLLEAARNNQHLKRIVHISSFTVYGTASIRSNTIINEATAIEKNLKNRNDAYTYVKVKQELLVRQYHKQFNLPIVILRPGVIYGPRGDEISRRVGISLFGLFLNIGTTNLLPLSYVDNCADAIILASRIPDINGEIINIHDNDLRTCNEFLSRYKVEVKKIRSINVPYSLFWLFSWLVERYADFSKGQIPPVLSRYKTASTWKSFRFNNKKLVTLLGWSQTVDTDSGLNRHFRYYNDLYSKQNKLK